jgi:iron complex outermembrane receptor protein
VLTGRINDVGAYTRVNVPHSYRAGIELQGAYNFATWFNVNANLTFSRNKIKTFNEFLDDYNVDWDWIGQRMITHSNTDIAFSPTVTAAAAANFIPVKNLEISLLAKYVSDQFLDNTQSHDRMLNAYYTQDARVIVTLRNKLFKECNLIGQVNNVFNAMYEPNGYTYGYVLDGNVQADNYYFPMAKTNFMIGLNIKL